MLNKATCVVVLLLGFGASGVAIAGDALSPADIANGTGEVTKSNHTLGSALSGDMIPDQPRFFRMDDVLARHGIARRTASPQLASREREGGSLVDFDSTRLSVAVSDEPFGLFTFRAPKGLVWAKWQGVQAAAESEAQLLADCRAKSSACTEAGRKFLSLAARSKAGNDRAQIAAVNLQVNMALEYVTDYVRHGVADRWTSSLATLSSGTADCEDYAILKYSLLREMGYSAERLRILLVRDRSVAMDHAVLAVKSEGRWLILDNRRAAPMEVSDVSYFQPLFALDEQGVKLFAAPYASNLTHESEQTVEPAAEALAGSGAGSALLLL